MRIRSKLSVVGSRWSARLINYHPGEQISLVFLSEAKNLRHQTPWWDGGGVALKPRAASRAEYVQNDKGYFYLWHLQSTPSDIWPISSKGGPALNRLGEYTRIARRIALHLSRPPQTGRRYALLRASLRWCRTGPPVVTCSAR